MIKYSIEIWLACSFLNWGMVCGFLRAFPSDTGPLLKEYLLIFLAVVFSPAALPAMLLTGGWRRWAWYPETTKQREGRVMLRKLES